MWLGESASPARSSVCILEEARLSAIPVTLLLEAGLLPLPLLHRRRSMDCLHRVPTLELEAVHVHLAFEKERHVSARGVWWDMGEQQPVQDWHLRGEVSG